MKRLALCIVRSGNPIKRPPEGRSLRDAPSVNGTQKQNAFSGASALFRTPAPLFSPFFSGKTEKNGPPEAQRAIPAQKRYGPRSGGCGFANRTAPPEASGATKMKKPHIRADKRGRRRKNEKVLC